MSKARRAAEKASLAAFLAAKYGTEGSRTARVAVEQAKAGSSPYADDGEVEMLGEQTWEERDAAARSTGGGCGSREGVQL